MSRLPSNLREVEAWDQPCGPGRAHGAFISLGLSIRLVHIGPPFVGLGLAKKTTGDDLMAGYYDTQHLADFGKIADVQPDLGKKFFEYYGAVFADGALTAREKSLIALAVAHAVQCPYCIDAYTQDCQQKGADIEQMTEALHVAVAIRGGASLVHGMQMRDKANKLGM